MSIDSRARLAETLGLDPRERDARGVTRVYLSPGMFGFAELASFDYFGHVVRAIRERFAAAGREARVMVCDVHPTASIRRRAARLATMIRETAGEGGPIHVVGHSTGGLDARLVASPSARLFETKEPFAWIPRLRSVTTMNTPHFGTPLASFFATVSGQRLLYAVSAITVTALKLGAPPLAATSALVAAFGRLSLASLEIELVDRTVESIIHVLDDAASRELRAWLKLVRDDQGSMIQLMPEAMDLFQAGVEDRDGVRYQCVATYATPNAVKDWIGAMRSPWLVVSATLFTLLSNITARQDERYPCSPELARADRTLRALLGEVPPPGANDGIVPLRSQLWGELIWCGKADHLDIVGHFPGKEGGHVDWLASGARFNRVRFDVVMDRVVAGMLLAEDRRAQEPHEAAPLAAVELR